ncbi:MAG: CBS domain-containing protein [Anaerolineae bacterium]|nr:CBS domain-containing protein [Anaerolineae bacterium]
MQREPIIFVVSDRSDGVDNLLEEALRQRYNAGYRIVVSITGADLAHTIQQHREQEEEIALFIYEPDQGLDNTPYLEHMKAVYPKSRLLLFTDDAETLFSDINRQAIDYYLGSIWNPPESKLYPVIDELLAEWRASIEMPFVRVKGIMTVRAVRIRLKDTLHRAAEVIALSGVGDLMVIDDDNNFVGVLSVGDVLRAAMPNTDEIIGEGGTLDQAFRLFLRKGSDLMYKPVEPLVIRQPLTVDPEDHVAKVAILMIEKNIHRLPVVKDGRLIGTVGRTDICLAVVGTL